MVVSVSFMTGLYFSITEREINYASSIETTFHRHRPWKALEYNHPGHIQGSPLVGGNGRLRQTGFRTRDCSAFLLLGLEWSISGLWSDDPFDGCSGCPVLNHSLHVCLVKTFVLQKRKMIQPPNQFTATLCSPSLDHSHQTTLPPPPLTTSPPWLIRPNIKQSTLLNWFHRLSTDSSCWL